MTNPKIISRDITVIPTVGESSEIQILTNLSRVHDFNVKIMLGNEFKQEANGDNPEGKSKSTNKPIKASIHLVYEPSNRDNKPFFVVTYHGHSISAEIRKQELQAINAEVQKCRQMINGQFGIWVDDYVIMGDFNENILEEKDGACQLLEVPLAAIIETVGAGAIIQDGALPAGCMVKQGGTPDQSSDLHTNPQAENDQKPIPNDSKDFILWFRFHSRSADTDTTSNTRNFIADLKQGLLGGIEADLLTGDRNHFGSKLLQVFGVALRTDSYLPTGGMQSVDPKTIDDAHLDSTLKSAQLKQGQRHYFTCNTGAGTKNKSPYFNKNIAAKAATLLKSDWSSLLNNYKIQRENSWFYYPKDRLFPNNLRLRQQKITQLQTKLEQFASSPELSDAMKLEDDVLTLVKHCKAGLGGVAFKRCLNQIEYQIVMDKANRAQWGKNRISEDFFLSYEALYLQEVPKTPIFDLNITACHSAIAQYHMYAKNLDEEQADVCHRVAYELTQSLNRFYADYNRMTPSDLIRFKTKFSAIAHSQDQVMSNHRGYAGLVMDLVAAVLTLGVFHLSRAAWTKASTGTATFGIFRQETTRMKLLGEAERICHSAFEPGLKG